MIKTLSIAGTAYLLVAETNLKIAAECFTDEHTKEACLNHARAIQVMRNQIVRELRWAHRIESTPRSEGELPEDIPPGTGSTPV